MNWYCIHTKPQKEAQVEAYLRAMLSLETYCPQLREYRTVGRVRRPVLRPLFPRYLFCRFDLAVSYRAVRYAPDALHIVTTGGLPAVVSDSLVAELRHWVDEVFDPATVQPSLCSGATVEITDGPLRGLAAVILHSRNDQDRVAILLSLLNDDARITIRRDWLKPLSHPEEQPVVDATHR